MIYVPKTVEETEFLRAWVEKRLPDVDIGNDSYCIAVLRDEKIIAVAAFYNYRKVDIEICFAADHPRWATKEVIAFILGFPFVQLDCQRCTSMVAKSNKVARKLNLGVGFKEEGKHRHAGPHLETMFSYGYTRADYMARYGNVLKSVPDSAPVDLADGGSHNSESVSDLLVSHG